MQTGDQISTKHQKRLDGWLWQILSFFQILVSLPASVRSNSAGNQKKEKKKKKLVTVFCQRSLARIITHGVSVGRHH